MSIVERAIVRAKSTQPADPATDSRAEPIEAKLPARGAWSFSEHGRNLPRVDLDPSCLEVAGLSCAVGQQRRQMQEFRGIKRGLLSTLETPQAGRYGSLIAVASALSGEGKTFLALNLARSLAAEVDRSVLLVDADLPKRDLTRGLKLGGNPGLGDYLLSRTLQLQDVVVATTVPQLYVLPAGSAGENSAELLASGRMRDLANQLADMGPETLVVFDSSPLLLAPDAGSLLAVTGTVVVVIRSMVSQKAEVVEALRRIDSNKNVMAIMNAWEPAGFVKRRYGYEYYGDYGSAADSSGNEVPSQARKP